MGQLIGERVDSALTGELKDFIGKYPGVLGAYDISLHQYGPERLKGTIRRI